MTEDAVARILRLLDEIRDAIAAQMSSGKDRLSPNAPRKPEEERRTRSRRATDTPTAIKLASDVADVAAKTSERLEPPGKTFRRVRVTAETEVTTTKKNRATEE